MIMKTTTLDFEALEGSRLEFASELGRILKEKSARVSPVELAQIAGVVFQRTFAGTRREEKLANALALGLSVREQMAAEEGGSMSADEAARYLGMSKQSVLNLYHTGKVLAWRTEKQGALRFPVWQFAEHRRLAGLAEILTKLSEPGVLDDWGKIGFFLQTHGMLDDRRALDLLRDNKLDLVLKAAEAYAQ